MSDLIKRSDAIKVAEGLLIKDDSRHLNDLEYGNNNALAHVIDGIEDLPSAERTGRWVTDIYKHGKDRHRCSECGEGSRESANYCPNCGARMIGGSDE